MAVAGAGKNSFQDESPASSSSFSPFNIFILSSFRSIFVRASPLETINEVISGIAALTRFPAGELRLQDESGHELPGDCPIGLCGLDENSISLRLAYPLLATKHSGACAAANELVSFVTILLSTGKIKIPGFLNIFTNLFRKFLDMTPTVREEDIVGHLHAFIFSGAHTALGMLWQSPVIIHRHFALYGLNLFLELNRIKFPQSFDFYYLPVLLELADEFMRMAGRENPLYLQCRKAVGDLLCSKNWRFSGHSNMENMVPALYPFVVDLVEEITMSLSTESTSPPPIHQLCCFLKQMRREFKDRAAAGAHPFLQTEQAERVWFLYFYRALKKLKNKLFHCLGKIETFMAEKAEGEVKFLLRQRMNILDVLFCFHKLCKIFDPKYGFVSSLIFARRSPLNALIRHADKSHTYYWLLQYKEALDFEVKVRLLMMLFADTNEGGYRALYLFINRLHLLSDSFIQIGQVNAMELHAELSVLFKDEEGTGHGVTREWFYLLCQEIFSPKMKLFSPCETDRRRFFPNPTSPCDRTQLEYYRFAGRFVALALRHEFQIGVTFDRIFFNQLADKGIDLEDVQDADPALYMSCKKLLEMDDEFLDSDALGLTFVRETEDLGCRKMIPLCPRGEEIVVNSRNKEEFVSFLIESYYVESIDQKIHYFREGFMDLFSNIKFENLFFQSLNLEDFDRMLRGSEEKINIDDWKNHTVYCDYEAEDQQIISFWKIVEGMQEEQRRLLLQFWISIRFLPVGGFCNLPQKLYIFNSFEKEEDNWPLPTSQTCFHQLQLPPYPSMSIMHQKLHFITQEHVSCTFGLY
ncbi:E3 ubiquitin-protein ligase UPL5 [Platanthera guangdongensis]|uniref:HECT-type E3 ubiquitin transferase n=1 Tax=Platanthera guangdongensis TaxID=2320717 RepID=A0ABR2MGF4_9ASPA